MQHLEGSGMPVLYVERTVLNHFVEGGSKQADILQTVQG